MHAPGRRPDARIAKVDGVGSEGAQAPSQWGERCVLRQEKVEEVLPFMRFWHRQAVLLEQGLEILFRRLLTVEARGVAFGFCECGQGPCDFYVLLGFENPLRSLALHTGPFPSPSLRGETSRNRLPVS